MTVLYGAVEKYYNRYTDIGVLKSCKHRKLMKAKRSQNINANERCISLYHVNHTKIGGDEAFLEALLIIIFSSMA